MMMKKMIERTKFEALAPVDFFAGLGETFDFGIPLLYHGFYIYE